MTAQKSQSLFSWELFAGFHHTLHSDWLGSYFKDQVESQFGFSLGMLSPINLSGQVWKFAMPEFHEFDYTYKAQSMRFSLKGKLILKKDWFVQPYVSASLGLAMNKASGYVATATNGTRLEPPFTNRTQTSLSYGIGFGVQKDFDANWQAGIAYEFVDWGTSSLGPSQGSLNTSGPKLENLYANTLQFTLTYIYS